MVTVTQTLRFRLTAAFVLLIACTASLMGIAVHRIGTANLHRLHTRTGEIVSRHLVAAALDDLSRVDHDALQARLAGLRREPFVCYAEFRDRAGDTLVAWSALKDEALPTAKPPARLPAERIFAGEHYTEFHVPVLSDPADEGSAVGSLRVGLTQKPLLERVGEGRRQILLLVVIAILAGGYAAFALVRSALRPVADLIHATREISFGDFQAADPLRVHGELGTLAQALRRMGKSLQRSHEQLRHAKTELTHEVAKRTAELQQALDELKVTDRLKDEFLSSVSHEFRTPLTSIRAFAEILLQFEDEDPATRREFLDIILRESDRLTNLVNDTLDLARIEAGDLNWQMQPIDLLRVAEDALRSFRPLLSQHTLSAHIVADTGIPTVRADKDRIFQVFTNLLSNAIKFSADGGAIRITAHATDDEVEIVVEDHGHGIAQCDHERIFERFQQIGDTLTAKPTGTGLGLSISRNIIERHGGRIWVESAEGVGSRFHVALPIAGPTDLPHGAPGPRAESAVAVIARKSV